MIMGFSLYSANSSMESQLRGVLLKVLIYVWKE